MAQDPNHETFVRLLAANQGRIHAFIMALVCDWTITEELFQDTCVVLWQKFEQYDPDGNFAAWACKMAHYKVLKWRGKQARQREICNDQFLESVMEVQEEISEQYDARCRALAECMQRLRTPDREMLRLRYVRECRAKEIASEVDRSVESVYKSLQRIRRSLLACIRFRLAQEEHS